MLSAQSRETGRCEDDRVHDTRHTTFRSARLSWNVATRSSTSCNGTRLSVHAIHSGNLHTLSTVPCDRNNCTSL